MNFTGWNIFQQQIPENTEPRYDFLQQPTNYLFNESNPFQQPIPQAISDDEIFTDGGENLTDKIIYGDETGEINIYNAETTELDRNCSQVITLTRDNDKMSDKIGSIFGKLEDIITEFSCKTIDDDYISEAFDKSNFIMVIIRRPITKLDDIYDLDFLDVCIFLSSHFTHFKEDPFQSSGKNLYVDVICSRSSNNRYSQSGQMDFVLDETTKFAIQERCRAIVLNAVYNINQILANFHEVLTDDITEQAKIDNNFMNENMEIFLENLKKLDGRHPGDFETFKNLILYLIIEPALEKRMKKGEKLDNYQKDVIKNISQISFPIVLQDFSSRLIDKYIKNGFEIKLFCDEESSKESEMTEDEYLKKLIENFFEESNTGIRMVKCLPAIDYME